MASSQGMHMARSACDAGVRSVKVFVRDVARGLLAVTHNAFALIGLLIAAVALFGAERADIRHEAEMQALGWLKARQEARVDVPVGTTAPAIVVGSSAAHLVPAPAPTPTTGLGEPDAVGRATASDLRELSRPQAVVALWLARRYKVAPEPVGALVKEAWQVGSRAGLDPTLILAIMAVESSFNPFAQSAVGAQGLMQVMTKVHNAKYEAFGGKRAAFDPVTNLRVGVEVLKECILRAGSLEAGLRFYVGAGNESEDGGYAGRVLSEQNSLRQVVGSKAVPARPPVVSATAASRHDHVPAVSDDVPAPAPAPAAPEQIALLP